MATRMLIDARHSEETRVAVLKGNRIEEFDFESAEHKQIKGNIYLAKVTRVEPSLQAAFVDFGGNRHGFLAFSEIHPDYYQIPQADREALIAEELAHAEEEAALRAAEDDDDDLDGHDEDGGVEEIDTSEKDDVSVIEDGQVNDSDEYGEDEDRYDADEGEDGESRSSDDEAGDDNGEDNGAQRRGRRRQGRSGGRNGNGGNGGGRAKEMDELRARRQALRRRYKIQDVIQRRQVLLVQVVKEERGNKGAALTTYLSLAGRYCVLMPNSSNGGGISRKISSGSDRKRLKQIVSELTLPRSMGLIVRTAGLQRTKVEIKRDFDYLARLWDEIREKTLGSSAPAMIHTDSDLVKRAIRDIYNREIEEVVVEGEEGYKSARAFMKLLMPSHVRRVKAYSDPVPLFQRFGAEDQLSAMYDPVVQLKSGGYLVINPTEALVSIDINSGRSTKEHGIEATAVSTNLEAAREIARQLRLRDMAGLVVIDFIDMEYGSNVRKVEKAMKDALKNDRARIQVGRISGFGLMEMSRQRLRTGVLEATTRGCPHCDGTGLVRTASSAGLSALRLIEDEAAKGKGTTISLYASTEAAVYLLNAKRADLSEIEDRYGVNVEVIPEGENEGAKMRVGSSGPRPLNPPKFAPVSDIVEDDLVEDYEDEIEEEEAEEERRPERSSERAERRPEREAASDEEGEGRGKRRRRRGGRNRRRREEGDVEDGEQRSEAAEDGEFAGEADSDDGEDRAENGRDGEAAGDDQPRKRRRRGGRNRRRGGRDRDGAEGTDATTEGNESELAADEAGAEQVETQQVAAPIAEDVSEEVVKPRRTRRKKADVEAEAASEVVAEAAPVAEAAAEEAAEAPAKPKRTRRKKADVEAEAQVKAVAEAELEVAEAAEVSAEEAPAKPKRTRRKKADAEVVAEAVPAPVAEPAPVAAGAEAPAAEGGELGEGDDDGQNEDGSPRRGWWQRTFGA